MEKLCIKTCELFTLCTLKIDKYKSMSPQKWAYIVKIIICVSVIDINNVFLLDIVYI